MSLPDAPAIGPARRGSEGDNPGPSLPRRAGVAPAFALFKNRVRMLTPAHPTATIRRRGATKWSSPSRSGRARARLPVVEAPPVAIVEDVDADGLPAARRSAGQDVRAAHDLPSPLADHQRRGLVDGHADQVGMIGQDAEETIDPAAPSACWSTTAPGRKPKPVPTVALSWPPVIITRDMIAAPADVPPRTPPRPSTAFSARSTAVPR